MKLRIATVFLFFLLLLPACENGVVISYTPDELLTTKFIKSEKLKGQTEELDCEYNEESHKHSTDDSYYIYFTLKSKFDTPINPENKLFSDIQKSLSIEFQKEIPTETGNVKSFETDNNIHTVGDIEFVSEGRNLNKRQNFNFLIDMMDTEECLEGDDLNNCSLSSGLEPGTFKTLINGIMNSFGNEKTSFDSENSNFIEDDFIGLKLMAFSLESDNTTWFHTLVGFYLNDMDECSGSFSSSDNKKKIKCWLEREEEEAYKGLKDNAKFHRKLWDAYVSAAEIVKKDNSENKNLVLITSGYEEKYYDTSDALSSDNMSVSEENDFFTIIKASDNIPVFIAVQDRGGFEDDVEVGNNSFPDNDDLLPNKIDIDNKFYKLACLTNGAYFSHKYDEVKSRWRPIKPSDYDSLNGITSKIKHASYGTWRVKVKFKKDTPDRIYDGILKVSGKNTKNEDVSTSLVGYRVIR